MLIDALCKKGNVREARKVLAVMVKACVRPNSITLNTLMDGYYSLKEVENDRHLFSTMTETGITPSVYSDNITINGFCRNKMM